MSNNYVQHIFPRGKGGITIGQIGQMPAASRLWGPHAWILKHSFTGFPWL